MSSTSGSRVTVALPIRAPTSSAGDARPEDIPPVPVARTYPAARGALGSAALPVLSESYSVSAGRAPPEWDDRVGLHPNLHKWVEDLPDRPVRLIPSGGASR